MWEWYKIFLLVSVAVAVLVIPLVILLTPSAAMTPTNSPAPTIHIRTQGSNVEGTQFTSGKTLVLKYIHVADEDEKVIWYLSENKGDTFAQIGTGDTILYMIPLDSFSEEWIFKANQVQSSLVTVCPHLVVDSGPGVNSLENLLANGSTVYTWNLEPPQMVAHLLDQSDDFQVQYHTQDNSAAGSIPIQAWDANDNTIQFVLPDSLETGDYTFSITTTNLVSEGDFPKELVWNSKVVHIRLVNTSMAVTQRQVFSPSQNVQITITQTEETVLEDLEWYLDNVLVSQITREGSVFTIDKAETQNLLGTHTLRVQTEQAAEITVFYDIELVLLPLFDFTIEPQGGVITGSHSWSYRLPITVTDLDRAILSGSNIELELTLGDSNILASSVHDQLSISGNELVINNANQSQELEQKDQTLSVKIQYIPDRSETLVSTVQTFQYQTIPTNGLVAIEVFNKTESDGHFANGGQYWFWYVRSNPLYGSQINVFASADSRQISRESGAYGESYAVYVHKYVATDGRLGYVLARDRFIYGTSSITWRQAYLFDAKVQNEYASTLRTFNADSDMDKMMQLVGSQNIVNTEGRPYSEDYPGTFTILSYPIQYPNNQGVYYYGRYNLALSSTMPLTTYNTDSQGRMVYGGNDMYFCRFRTDWSNCQLEFSSNHSSGEYLEQGDGFRQPCFP